MVSDPRQSRSVAQSPYNNPSRCVLSLLVFGDDECWHTFRKLRKCWWKLRCHNWVKHLNKSDIHGWLLKFTGLFFADYTVGFKSVEIGMLRAADMAHVNSFELAVGWLVHLHVILKVWESREDVFADTANMLLLVLFVLKADVIAEGFFRSKSATTEAFELLSWSRFAGSQVDF